MCNVSCSLGGVQLHTDKISKPNKKKAVPQIIQHHFIIAVMGNPLIVNE